MTDPKIGNFDSTSRDHDSPRSLQGFQRIQVNHPQRPVIKEYQDLPRMHQQELLSRLIDHVREL
ncbi:MAG: hypothetical protein ABFD24_08310 [Anaerolineaceae bacterium]|jgi:hypothetical protein